MAHVDDGQLNALLDGELSPEETRAVESHVATCAECARRLEEARTFLSEAGELLAVLTPPPRAAEPVAAAPPKIAKTAKEIAVSLDGRTEMTPAIRPVFKHEVPAAPKRSWKMPDLEKMAWAASLVLCLGVGYLANEVFHLRQQQTTADNGRQRQTDVVAAPDASPTAGAPAERRLAEPTAHQPAVSAAGSALRPTDRSRAAEERAPNVTGAPGPKPRVSKPAPDIARTRPEQLASNQPATPTAAPTSAAPPAPAVAGALGDLAGASARSPARSAAGAGSREAGAANRLDEITITDAAARQAVPTTFRRTTMDDAVRHLAGSIRLIDGMNPSRVEIGPGRLVPGADPDREVVRVTYTNGTNRLVLEQQLGDPQAGGSFNGLMPGDTLVTALGSNGTQIRWLDRKFWLSVTGGMGADSVRAIVERIR